MSFRTFRDNSRSALPAAVGVGALIAGAAVLQFGFGGTSVQSATADLAADRSAESTANRGAARTEVTGAPALIVAPPASVPVTEPPTTVPVTEAPTTTAAPVTTAAPTTTAAPRRTTTTTAAPVSTAQRLVEGAATTVPPAPKAESVPTSATDVWTRLAKCESGIKNDGGAPYYGYFQFSAQTWRGVGGTGLPNDHSYAVQLEFAKKLQARSGWGQWPVCSKVALAG